MELVVHTQGGAPTSRKVKLPLALLLPEGHSSHPLYLEIKRYRAALRQGTHKTKQRGEIKGSTRKLRKQKGSGMARVGSIKSPIFRGGGTVFGPQPRNHALRLNKKTRRLARRLALDEKLRAGAVTLVEQVKLDEAKTKAYLSFLKNFSLEGARSLLVTDQEASKEIRLASRNLPGATVAPASRLSAYDLMSHQRVIVEEEAVASLSKLWAQQPKTDAEEGVPEAGVPETDVPEAKEGA